MKQNNKKIANFTDKGSSTRQVVTKPHHWPLSNRNSRSRDRLRESAPYAASKGDIFKFEKQQCHFHQRKEMSHCYSGYFKARSAGLTLRETGLVYD